MSNLHNKVEMSDLVKMINDTSRYIGDIFTIDNPEFEKKTSLIYIRHSYSQTTQIHVAKKLLS